MATNDNPSRIAQVFADRHLIGEALAAAAADAIDQHLRAGTPVVICQDGRIEQVRAEQLVPDIDRLMAGVTFEVERTAKELLAWFEDRFSSINKYRLAREATLGHHRGFKKFYPFALWLHSLYSDREDVTCSLASMVKVDGRFDAVVKDGATDPITVTYVQLLVTAIDDDAASDVSHEEQLKRTFRAIERAVGRRSSLGRGPDYVLVVCFDDFMWFGTDDDRAALRAFVSERLAAWRLNIATLYVVGTSGRTFESFSVPRR